MCCVARKISKVLSNNIYSSYNATHRSILPTQIRRSYSTIYTTNATENFFLWLVGLVDGEGCFIINRNGPNLYIFQFIIDLHVDDAPALEIIQQTLGFGKITSTKSIVRFIVQKQEDIKKFSTYYPLKTTKRLNFLAMKKGF